MEPEGDETISLTSGDDDAELVDLLDTNIYAFNAAATGMSDGRRLTIRATTGSGRLVGGLSGWTFGGCGYVDVLWVDGDHREQGLGSMLMDHAEAEAVLRGCTQMVLSTHSFQAPGFYAKRGYTETGRTPDYPTGYDQIHLRKPL